MSAVLGVYASASADSALLCRIHDCTFASSALFAASRVSTSLEKFGRNDGADVHLRGPAASLVADPLLPSSFVGKRMAEVLWGEGYHGSEPARVKDAAWE